MKTSRILAAALLAALILPATIRAATATVNGIEWTYFPSLGNHLGSVAPDPRLPRLRRLHEQLGYRCDTNPNELSCGSARYGLLQPLAGAL